VYFSRRLGGKITRLSGKKVQVVETLYLGQRKAVHLIKIGRREILIGSTNENVNMIADVTETFGDLTGFVEDSEKEEQ
jgi:flagellar biogenesis protein FliO